MAEYIDKESLLERIKDLDTWSECKYGGFTLREYPFGMFDCDDVVNTIESSPAADVAPVVRCANCKYLMSHLTDGPVCGHSYGLRAILGNSFCPYGEYRADGGVDDAAD